MAHFDVAKHLLEIMAATPQSQVIQDILIHQLNVGIPQLNGSIVVSVRRKMKIMSEWKHEPGKMFAEAKNRSDCGGRDYGEEGKENINMLLFIPQIVVCMRQGNGIMSRRR